MFTRIISAVTTPLMMGLLSVTLMSGIYVKGRMDGYNTCLNRGLKVENQQLIEELVKIKDDTQKQVDRIIEENKTFKQLNKDLKRRIEDIVNEIPENDTACDYPDGSADSLRNAIEETNRAVFGEPAE